MLMHERVLDCHLNTIVLYTPVTRSFTFIAFAYVADPGLPYLVLSVNAHAYILDTVYTSRALDARTCTLDTVTSLELWMHTPAH